MFLAKCLYQRLIDLSGNDGSILVPDNINAESSITVLFQKLAEEMYTTFKGTLKCGNLESKIILSPGPVVSILAYSEYSVFFMLAFICSHIPKQPISSLKYSILPTKLKFVDSYL